MIYRGLFMQLLALGRFELGGISIKQGIITDNKEALWIK